jgi:leucyl-tRNA synthetase
MQFNTVASAAMKMLNALQEAAATPAAAQPGALQLAVHEAMSILLRVLYPITPHVAHALWRELGFAGELMDARWPAVDKAALETDEIELVVQVNGKLRGHIRVPKDADRATIEYAALANEAARKHLDGKELKKVIVVPGKLVNVVVA